MFKLTSLGCNLNVHTINQNRNVRPREQSWCLTFLFFCVFCMPLQFIHSRGHLCLRRQAIWNDNKGFALYRCFQVNEKQALWCHLCLKKDPRLKKMLYFSQVLKKYVFYWMSFNSSTHRHMFHWHLWSYHWGRGQCRCNHPVCFCTADLNDTPSVCTHLYLRVKRVAKRACDCVFFFRFKRRIHIKCLKAWISHLYSGGSWAESPARRHIGSYRWC